MVHRIGLDKARVVEEAARLIDEDGLEQLSLGRLAERLGVRTPSLYNHVAGLGGLKRDLALYCLRDLFDHTLRSAVGKAREEAIIAFSNAYLTYSREMPGRYMLTLAPNPDDPEAQQVAGKIVEVIAAILAPIIWGKKAPSTLSALYAALFTALLPWISPGAFVWL
ncbi:hypothetical protein KSX_62950 [Ktedonospora formicarum]|uniref:HTH tetR-type domain-containing protein n=1 Tax=Ktedonospora formicarum TaxID=2778364 RepID=A0A8J3MTD9_9CHLR|nr:TetR/AcrR family transcriptional regulator [Ktedonospora formicarum]GHO48132.1 hypothetical protein KSX_62950 [Ktedonospora formicarum]